MQASCEIKVNNIDGVSYEDLQIHLPFPLSPCYILLVDELTSLLSLCMFINLTFSNFQIELTSSLHLFPLPFVQVHW